jgi:hypothetical protein
VSEVDIHKDTQEYFNMKKLLLSKVVQKAQPLIELYDGRKQIFAKTLITSREVATAEQDCLWALFIEIPIALALSGFPGGQFRVLYLSAKILKYSYS